MRLERGIAVVEGAYDVVCERRLKSVRGLNLLVELRGRELRSGVGLSLDTHPFAGGVGKHNIHADLRLP